MFRFVLIRFTEELLSTWLALAAGADRGAPLATQ